MEDDVAPSRSGWAPRWTRRQVLQSLVFIPLTIYEIRRPKVLDLATATLLWSEDFDRLDLASDSNPDATWRPCDIPQPLDQGYVDFGSGGSTWNVNPNQMLAGMQRSLFSVGNSILTLRAISTPVHWAPAIAQLAGRPIPKCGSFLVTNSAVRTFGYGYYEFRVAFPNAGPGMFPSMWMYAAHDSAPPEKGGAEIDLLEIFGRATGTPWNTTLHSAMVNNGPSAIGNDEVAQTDGSTHEFHVYGMDWTANRMDFYQDNRKVGSASDKFVRWMAGLRMDIRLNYAMDARWFRANQRSNGSTPNPLVMQVDYIRQWDSKPTAQPVGDTPVVPIL